MKAAAITFASMCIFSWSGLQLHAEQPTAGSRSVVTRYNTPTRASYNSTGRAEEMQAGLPPVAAAAVATTAGQPTLADQPATAVQAGPAWSEPVSYGQVETSRARNAQPVVAPRPLATTQRSQPILPRRAGLPPIQTHFDDGSVQVYGGRTPQRLKQLASDPSLEIAEPGSSAETVTRPWEVTDSPALLKSNENSSRLQARQLPQPATDSRSATIPPPVHTAELAIGDDTAPATSSAWYENSLRQSSPVPASSLVAPTSPARPVPRVANRSLLGNEAEYRERDGFTYSVQSGSIGGQPRASRSRATSAPARASRPLEGLNPAQPLGEGKPREAAAPRPLTTSANLERTAPARWFRTNPLREASVANRGLRNETYVQQTSAQAPAGEAPAAEGAEPLPSIADEQPLPFDLNAAENEAAGEPTAPAAEPLEEGLSLDDLPFDDTEKKTPAETKQPLPDSPFPKSSTQEAPAAETPAPEKTPAPTKEDELPFPFDDPTKEKAPADVAPEKEMPAEEAPTTEPPATEEPVEEAPAEEAPTESSPLDESPTQSTTEAAVGTKLKPINAITTSIAAPSGELPADRSGQLSNPEEEAIYYSFGQASRGWAVSNFNWEATAMCHQPLYFEEVNLERYGYSRGALQPAASYGQFLVNVISMPYKVIAQPSREAVYTLGHYRPGSYAPYQIHYPPRSAAGGMFEAGVVLGLVFLIP